LEAQAWINKIERFNGFHCPVEEEKRAYRNTGHLIPERWIETMDSYDREDDFIKAKGRFFKPNFIFPFIQDTMYGYVGLLFLAFTILSSILAYIIIWKSKPEIILELINFLELLLLLK
jgi:hypothetical protein